jgi:hypothetical protein
MTAVSALQGTRLPLRFDAARLTGADPAIATLESLYSKINSSSIRPVSF